jgi:hypothetical protein
MRGHGQSPEGCHGCHEGEEVKFYLRDANRVLCFFGLVMVAWTGDDDDLTRIEITTIAAWSRRVKAPK